MPFVTLLGQEGIEPAGFNVSVPLMAGGGMILLVVALLVWALVSPNVGRALARIFAVLAIGLGAGLLAWGIVAASTTGTVRSPLGFEWLIREPSEVIGWGAGSLAAGITALVLSFVVGLSCGDWGRDEGN
jgi:hypothetical protein